MKTTTQVITESGIPSKLVRSTLRQLGDKDYLEDIMNHGADAGYHGFIYYSETVEFFKRNRAAIVELVNRMAEDLGESPIDMVAGFRCLDPKDRSPEKLSEIGRCLYSGRLTNDDVLVPNALAWFALEEVARAFCDY